MLPAGPYLRHLCLDALGLQRLHGHLGRLVRLEVHEPVTCNTQTTHNIRTSGENETDYFQFRTYTLDKFGLPKDLKIILPMHC